MVEKMLIEVGLKIRDVCRE